jgi:hypothetical protein
VAGWTSPAQETATRVGRRHAACRQYPMGLNPMDLALEASVGEHRNGSSSIRHNAEVEIGNE